MNNTFVPFFLSPSPPRYFGLVIGLLSFFLRSGLSAQPLCFLCLKLIPHSTPHLQLWLFSTSECRSNATSVPMVSSKKFLLPNSGKLHPSAVSALEFLSIIFVQVNEKVVIACTATISNDCTGDERHLTEKLTTMICHLQKKLVKSRVALRNSSKRREVLPYTSSFIPAMKCRQPQTIRVSLVSLRTKSGRWVSPTAATTAGDMRTLMLSLLT